MKNTMIDGKWHQIDIAMPHGGPSVVCIDGEVVTDEATRRFLLGDAVVDAELIPPKLWRRAQGGL
jgi:hypothetical protein